MPIVDTIPLHETTRARYLNYALSVITSRALPDVRDGLKPVQRRILYAMHTSLRLYPEGRYRKSATVVGECFVKDTLVATEKGLRPIQEIRHGDLVHTEMGLKPVTELFEMPTRPLLDVELANGLTNRVTAQQPFRVMQEDWTRAWKNAEDLKPGDWVVVKKSVRFPHEPVALGTFEGRRIVLDEDVAYLVGALMSDGWVAADYGKQKHVRLGFCGSDTGVIERVRQVLADVFGYDASIEARHVSMIRVHHKALNRFLAGAFGLDATLDAASKFVPAPILCSPKSVVASFLAGLFDGDGSLDTRSARARYVSVSKKLIDAVQLVLQHLGIMAGRHVPRTSERNGWQPLHALEVHGAYAQKLAALLPFERANLKERAAIVAGMNVQASAWDEVPGGGAAVFGELAAHHQGGGWYRDREGNAFRQGIRYPNGTKIRYAADLSEQRLAVSQIEDWGIRAKLDRIGSPLGDMLEAFGEHDLAFVKVKSVSAAPAEPTYDLQVADDHNFVAGGMVVHNCMGKYHPHGDTAIYDAMVRMAQDFALRAPLVDGHGNFGSLDGDAPAAMRYTEAKLRPLAMEMLGEIRKKTVDFRPNFDGTLFEPVVLPSKVPNLLVNGASGIAVGMATNIPPHHLGEVVDALVYLVGSPNARTSTLVEKFIQGPDFPTGGRILNTPEELARIYEEGEGAIDLRGEYRLEGKRHVILTSVPYGMAKGDLVEKIAEHVALGKVPQLVDVRDESTDEVRVVLELRRGADPEAAMAYLFKHTPLQTRFHVNLTCLVPTENPEVPAPEKVNLATALRHFLDFRLDVVTRRLRFDLEALEKRIHLLKGFEKIFGALDEAIKIIRSSKDKADAAQRLMHRFRLDDVQADAILEIKLYKLARLEIDAIRKELAEKEKQAAQLRLLLADEGARWKLIRTELREIKKQYADARRTEIAGPDAQLEYTAEDYIIDEDVYVIVTRDGWTKRQRSYTELSAIRVREGDEIGWVLPASTRASVGFLTSFGKCYTLRADALAQTTGYGEPVQKLFDFSDKERVVGVVSFDERVLPTPAAQPDEAPELFETNGQQKPVGPYVVAVSAGGQTVRLLAEAYAEPSTRSGRLFMRLVGKDEVVMADVAAGDENLCLASQAGHVLIFPALQVPLFKSAAKGVVAMRLGSGDRVLGAALSNAARDGLEVETSRGRREIVRTTKFEVSNRGNKGRQVIKRGTLARVIVEPTEIRLNGEG